MRRHFPAFSSTYMRLVRSRQQHFIVRANLDPYLYRGTSAIKLDAHNLIPKFFVYDLVYHHHHNPLP